MTTPDPAPVNETTEPDVGQRLVQAVDVALREQRGRCYHSILPRACSTCEASTAATATLRWLVDNGPIPDYWGDEELTVLREIVEGATE